MAPRANLSYWRTAGGREVDFILEHEGRLLAVEVKASSNVSYKDTTHLRAFLDEYGLRVHRAIVLHAGSQVIPLADRILAAPWWRVL